MKAGRLDATDEPIRIALLLGDAALREALAAEIDRHADFEAVDIVETPDLLITDLADAIPEDVPDSVGLILIHTPGSVAAERPVRAILPQDLDPKRMVEAARLVAAGLIVLPDRESEESAAPDSDGISGTTTVIPSLTRREREVLDLLAAGASNKEIARRLGISVHTVKFHLASLLAKLGATSRLEAVGIGLRTGLIMV